MKKILLIEDNEEIRENTAEILELSSYKVIKAENGKEGVEKAIEFLPDLIICDIMMPVLDGFGVLHAIQKNEKIKNTPFIFLTAKTERMDFRKGMELGADDYITKPFSGTELLTAVDSRLKKLEQLKGKFSPDIVGIGNLITISKGSNTLKSLVENRNTNFYKRKQIIYSEGNHPNNLYYIIRGKVKAFKINENGKELVTELYGEGDFLGYIALLEGSIFKDTAEALEETEVAIIPKDDFEELIYKNVEVAKKFIRFLAKNITDMEEHLLGLAYNSLRKKVADAILFLQKTFNEKEKEKFTIDISRENLASIAGTATESLIRTLSDFRNEKLIEIKNGTIKILNISKLENLLN